MPAAVLYLRMSSALRDALRTRAETEGVSMNAFAVLKPIDKSGSEQRVLVRPERMKPIVDRYVTYWVDRLGIDAMSRVIANSKDHDRVWAWYVGREAELAELAAHRTT